MSFTSFSNDQPNKKSFIYNIPVAFRNTKKAAIKCGFSLLLSAQRLSFFLCLDYILTKHEMILVFRVGKFKSSYIHVAGMYLGMTFMGMEHNAELTVFIGKERVVSYSHKCVGTLEARLTHGPSGLSATARPKPYFCDW